MQNDTQSNVIETPSSPDGYRVGQASTDKVGMYGATPLAQASSAGEATGFTAETGTAVVDASTFTGNVGSTAYTIGDIVKHLKNLGVIAE